MLYVLQTKAALQSQVRADLRQMKADGTLPPELENLDIDTADFEGWDVEVSEGMMLRAEIANALAGLWFVWIPLVVSVCLAVAYVTGK